MRRRVFPSALISSAPPSPRSLPRTTPNRLPPSRPPKNPRTHSAMSFVIRARAKVNLHLEIGSRRRDGYHSLQSLFQEISLCDELRFRPAPTLSLTVAPS